MFLNKDSATSTVTFTSPGAAFTVLTVTVNLAGHGQLFQRWMTAPASTSAAIVAQIDWNSQYDAGTIAGTVSITQGSNFVSGAGTVFTTALRVNDQVIINNEVQTVQSITSDTVLFTYDNWLQATVSGQTLRRGAGPVIITAVTQTVGAIPNSLAIYKERNGVLAAVQLHQNPNGVPRGRFVVAGKESAGQSRKLFYFNGVNPVVFLQNDDATMTALTAYPPDWSSTVDPTKNPVNGTLHQGALFGWGNLSDPHRIYRSQTADHTKFTNVNPTDDAGQYPIASSIGERLWGGAEFQGVLFLWKYPRGIFYFDDTDPNFLNWTYHIRSEALGCAPSPHAVLPMDDDILFCAPDGHFHLLSAVANLGGVDTSDLTRMLGLHRWTREHLHIPSLGQMTSAYNTYSKIAYVGVRSRNATTPTNDLLLKFDFGLTKRGGPVRFSYTTALHPNALCTRRSASSGNPQSGTPLLLLGEQASAMLQLLDDGTVGTKLTHGFRNDAARGGQMQSTSYAIRAASPRLDFADADPMNRQRRKNYDAIEFIFGEADISDLSGQTLVADIVVDGVTKQRILLQNLTQTRVLRQLRVGDGYDWQCVLSTAAVTSATVQTPPVVPDLVSARAPGLLATREPGPWEHARLMPSPLFKHTLNLRQPTLAAGAVAVGMLAPGAAFRSGNAVGTYSSYALSALNTWTLNATLSLTTSGGSVLLSAIHGMYAEAPAGGASFTYQMRIQRDGTTITTESWNIANGAPVAGTTAQIPLPSIIWWDSGPAPSAATHSYTLWAIASGGNIKSNAATPPGWFQAVELA